MTIAALLASGAVQWLFGILGVAAAAFATWHAGKSSGQTEVKMAQAQQDIANIGVRNETDRKVAGMSDAAVRDALRDHYTHK